MLGATLTTALLLVLGVASTFFLYIGGKTYLHERREKIYWQEMQKLRQEILEQELQNETLRSL